MGRSLETDVSGVLPTCTSPIEPAIAQKLAEPAGQLMASVSADVRPAFPGDVTTCQRPSDNTVIAPSGPAAMHTPSEGQAKAMGWVDGPRRCGGPR